MAIVLDALLHATGGAVFAAALWYGGEWSIVPTMFVFGLLRELAQAQIDSRYRLVPRKVVMLDSPDGAVPFEAFVRLAKITWPSGWLKRHRVFEASMWAVGALVLVGIAALVERL
jgi:hypothetical protein